MNLTCVRPGRAAARFRPVAAGSRAATATSAPAADGVRSILATGDGKVEFVAFGSHTLAQ